MIEIDKIAAERYDIEVRSIVPYKDAFILNTVQGKKLMRKSILTPDRISFVHGAKEHLVKNRFLYVDRYLCTKENLPYINIDGQFYTILDFIDGSECNFDSRIEVARAARLLAAMHKASKGYIPPEGSKPRDELGKLPLYFAKRLDEIKKLKNTARKGKNKFDYMFLEHSDYFYKLGEDALNKLSNSKYSELANITRKEGSFCHHDFTHHNLVCSNDRIIIINFDFCCFELKEYDLANFIRRKMRKCNWDIQEAKSLLDEYRNVEKISEDEFIVMKYILQFPQKLWRVVNKYYNSRRSWTEKSYITRLQEVIDEKEQHRKFLDKYETLFS